MQQFGRAVARVVRTAITGQTCLWVSSQTWVSLAGAPVRPPIAVAAGELPVDGCLTRLPLLVVRPSEPDAAPGSAAWAAAGVPCWEVGPSVVRVWQPDAEGAIRRDVRRADDLLMLPGAAAMLRAGDLVVAAAAARVRRPRRVPSCDGCLTREAAFP